MGTSYSVTLAKPPRSSLSGSVATLLTRLDGLFSAYRSDSEVSRFNVFRSSEWFSVSVDTAAVVGVAQSVSRFTDGAFDITVDPLVRLWGFGPHRTGGTPSSEAIAQARQRVGWKKLSVRLDPPAFRKHDADLTIDLSGVAKGYAADAVAALLEREQIQDYLVAVGGELRAHGNSSLGRPWHVGIEEPLDNDRGIRCVVELRDSALSTSGDYRNFRVSAGRRRSHIIDPRTGETVADSVASVSVVAPRGVYADAMATALMVLGPDAGCEFATKKGLVCLFLLRTQNGIVEKQTPGFRERRVGKQ